MPEGLGTRPLISVVMASYCAEAYVQQALGSVLAQSLGDLEVIVCDDASSDGTVAAVTAIMRADPRVRLIALDANGGPAAARNRALDAAQGEWIAIVDADDRLHPERFERLMAAARHFEADVVADDLLLFDETSGSVGHLLEGEQFLRPVALTPALLVGDRGTPALGYLKPLIRAEVFRGLRYDETLRIGEDFELLLRLLLGGARAWLIPEPWYLYRRHAASISHRLSIETLEGMIASASRLASDPASGGGDMKRLLVQRAASLDAHRAYVHLAEALKAGRVSSALALLAQRPSLGFRLGGWLTNRLRSAITGRASTTSPPATERGTRIVLRERGCTAREAHAESVPRYVPAADSDWTASVDTATWLRVASLAIATQGALLPEGAAGAYAAGFSPVAIPPSPATDVVPSRDRRRPPSPEIIAAGGLVP